MERDADGKLERAAKTNDAKINFKLGRKGENEASLLLARGGRAVPGL